MIDISVSPALKTLWPDTHIAAFTYQAKVKEKDEVLWQQMMRFEGELPRSLAIEDIASLKPIADTREAYKACGKKPSRYRVSSEALYRRIVQKKGLYQVNSIVDLNNYISLMTAFSAGTFDLDKVHPPIVFDIGSANDIYYGIGRGRLNIDKLPVFRDKESAFGSPTSDSERAKVNTDSKSFLGFLISFSGVKPLEEQCDFYIDALKTYAGAEAIQSCIF